MGGKTKTHVKGRANHYLVNWMVPNDLVKEVVVLGFPVKAV